ncbi:MAG: alkaline phosphatase family protein [Chloroflexota bacterium]
MAAKPSSVLRWVLLLCLALAACTPNQAVPTAIPDTATPTSLPVASATPQDQPTQTSVPPTAAATQEPAGEPSKSVFLISWDGGRADIVDGWMAEGVLPHFAALAAQGLRAEYALSTDPSLTAAAQTAIATGSYPAHTGIVNNSYHVPIDSFYWYRRGFDELLDQAEPVWVSASRAGLTSAALFFVGGSPMLPGQTADYTIGYGIEDAYSRQVTVELGPLDGDWQGQAPASYSLPLEGSFTIQEVARLYLYVLDSQDDQAASYDTVIVSLERSFEASHLSLQMEAWGSLVLLPRLVAGADFLLQAIDSDRKQVTLFYSNVYHNTASPPQLLEALNQKFGFFPSGADYYALEHGWITPEQNLYLLERAARWMAEVSAWVYTSYHPDLLYTWQDAFDSAGHSYLMVDPRQLNYSPENAERYAAYYRQAAWAADQALEIMLQSIDLENTTVLMVADHGMSLLHTTVYVNTILQKAGLLTLDKKDYVVVGKTKAFAVASGGAVNVYINLAGREKDGILSEEEYLQVQAQVVELLSALTDPNSGEKVFQRVLRRDELGSLHLDHPNSGDVFAQANPGYHLDGWRGNPQVFAQPDFYGQHGYDSRLPDMHALFFAAGLGVPASQAAIPPVHIVDYAPTIACLLGFSPAASVDGQVIPALCGH